MVRLAREREHAIFRPSPTEWADWVISGPAVMPIFAKCCCKALAISPGRSTLRKRGVREPPRLRWRRGCVAAARVVSASPWPANSWLKRRSRDKTSGAGTPAPLAFDLANSGANAIDFPSQQEW